MKYFCFTKSDIIFGERGKIGFYFENQKISLGDFKSSRMRITVDEKYSLQANHHHR